MDDIKCQINMQSITMFYNQYVFVDVIHLRDYTLNTLREVLHTTTQQWIEMGKYINYT